MHLVIPIYPPETLRCCSIGVSVTLNVDLVMKPSVTFAVSSLAPSQGVLPDNSRLYSPSQCMLEPIWCAGDVGRLCCAGREVGVGTMRAGCPSLEV